MLLIAFFILGACSGILGTVLGMLFGMSVDLYDDGIYEKHGTIKFPTTADEEWE